MTAKERFLKIKAAFLGEAPATEPVIAAEPTSKVYKLKDGTEIMIAQIGDSLAIGDMVTASGVLPTAGEMELEDGSIIVVDATGAITEIKPAEPVTTDLSDVPAPTVEERIASLENKISQLVQPVGMATEVQLQAESQKITDQAKEIAKHEETIKGLFELVEQLLEVPTADPETLTGNKKERFERENKREERLNKIAETLKKNKALA
jgi:hypothetical protein